MPSVAAALSDHPLATHAVGETAGHLLEVGGPNPDAVVVFVTPGLLGALDDVVGALRHILAPRSLVGASAQSLLGGALGVDRRAALSVVAMWFAAEVATRPVRIDAAADSDPRRGLDPLEGASGTLLLLADPFSFRASGAFDVLADIAPGLRVVGAAASGAVRPGGNRLVIDGSIHDHGAVALHLGPTASLRVVLAQGCRPVGRPLTVTSARGRQLRTLGTEPALRRLDEVIGPLVETEPHPVAGRLRLGVVIDERREVAGPGDFRVVSVLSVDRSSGSITLSDDVQVGSTVQFQLRDPATAIRELRAATIGTEVSGALCFSDVDADAASSGLAVHGPEVLGAVGARSVVAGMSGTSVYGPLVGRNLEHDTALSALLVTSSERRIRTT